MEINDIARRIAEKECGDTQSIAPIVGSVSHIVFLINKQFVLRIARDHDAQRFTDEQAVIAAIEKTVATPHITAVGEIENNDETIAYSIAQYIPGTALSQLWPTASASEQERIIEKLAHQMQTLHTFTAEQLPHFTNASPFAERKTHQLKEWLGMAQRNGIPTDVHNDLQKQFKQLQPLYSDNQPAVLLHTDLNFSNILVCDNGNVVLLDFEWTMIGPPAYELRTLFTFALTPHAFLGAKQQVSYQPPMRFLHLLKKHYPALFDIPQLNEHMKLYMMEALLWAWSDGAAALQHAEYRAQVRKESLDIYTAVFQKNIVSTLLT